MALQLTQSFRTTKCDFQTYGKGGHISETEYLCVLAPNIISEKIFVFLWFWYLLLAAVGITNLVLILAMACRSGRVRILFLTRAVFSRKVIISSAVYQTSCIVLNCLVKIQSYAKL